MCKMKSDGNATVFKLNLIFCDKNVWLLWLTSVSASFGEISHISLEYAFMIGKNIHLSS